jgi:hypothetical protein
MALGVTTTDPAAVAVPAHIHVAVTATRTNAAILLNVRPPVLIVLPAGIPDETAKFDASRMG